MSPLPTIIMTTIDLHDDEREREIVVSLHRGTPRERESRKKKREERKKVRDGLRRKKKERERE